jgi:phosphoribosylformimino-5-aminoimidazole carboxamide ribotide isomerase
MGPPEVASEPGLWPENVILMTLDRVGMSTGADTARLRTLVGRAGSRRVFAAGGVRGAADIAALRAIGVAGALVATALHDGRLGPDALAGVLAHEE